MFSRIQSINLRTRASGKPRAASAISVISSRSCFSRASDRAGRRGHRCRVAASIWRPPRPAVLPRRAGPVVVVVEPSAKSRSACRHRPARAVSDWLLPMPLDGAAVHASVRAKASTEESRRCCRPEISRPAVACFRFVSSLQPFFSQLTILVEQPREPQLGRICRQAARCRSADDPPGEPADDLPNVFLEPADHDIVEHLLAAPARPGRSAEGQGSPAGRRSCWSARCAAWPRGRAGARTAPARSRMARVILESMAYFCAAGGRGVVGLVENQQRAGPEVAEPVAERAA